MEAALRSRDREHLIPVAGSLIGSRCGMVKVCAVFGCTARDNKLSERSFHA